MAIERCKDCGEHGYLSTYRCGKCQKKISKKTCPHKAEDVTGSWIYEGTKLVKASGYCLNCTEPHYYCTEQKRLVPKNKSNLSKAEYLLQRIKAVPEVEPWITKLKLDVHEYFIQRHKKEGS